MISSESKGICSQVKQRREEIKQQQRMKDYVRYDEGKIKAKGRVDANNSWWVSDLLAAECQKSVASSRTGGHSAEMAQLAA